MKRWDPRRADNRTLAEKLVGLIHAASEDDLREAQEILDRMGATSPKSRAARTQLPVNGVKTVTGSTQ